MNYTNIPNDTGRFNGTAEKPNATDYEFNEIRHRCIMNPEEKLFIAGNSFPGTTIVTNPHTESPHHCGRCRRWIQRRNC
jgi:hypothetical protein